MFKVACDIGEERLEVITWTKEFAVKIEVDYHIQ